MAPVRNNNHEDRVTHEVMAAEAASSKQGSNNHENEGKTQRATETGGTNYSGRGTESKEVGQLEKIPVDSMLLHCIHKHHRLHANWSLNCLRFIIRVMCCTEPVHRYVSGVAKEEAGGNFTMDRRFSDYFYRLLMAKPMQSVSPSMQVAETIRELEEYEIKYYGAARAEEKNQDADGEADVTVKTAEGKTSHTNEAQDPATMTAVDYFSRYRPIRQRKPNHLDRDQGIVCEIYLCEDAVDVENMHHVSFTFKNTNERPVHISLEFIPDGTEIHQTLPASSLKAKRVEPEGVLEMCRLPRYRFVRKWSPICRYKWTFTYAPQAESGAGSGPQLARVVASSTSSSTPLAAVVSSEGRPSNMQTVPAVVGPQLPQHYPRNNNNNNATNSANPSAGVSAERARDMNMQSVSQVVADPEKVSQLEIMGLGTRSQCEQALTSYANNLESAANHLLGAM
jgi:hypothetical protein